MQRGLEKINLEVLSNPVQGMAVEDCLHPDRVVVEPYLKARSIMRELYAPFVSEDRLFLMDPSSER